MNKYILAAFLITGQLMACKKQTKQNQDDGIQIPPLIPQQESNTPIKGISIKKGMISSTTMNYELSYNTFLTMDPDEDGRNDFYFTSVLIYHGGESHLYLIASPVSKNRGMLLLSNGEEMQKNMQSADPLNFGTVISENIQTNQAWYSYTAKGVLLDVLDKGGLVKAYNGPWVNKADKYLGIKMQVNGKAHFGWIRLTHNIYQQRILITGYAYNMLPAEPITAGDTGS